MCRIVGIYRFDNQPVGRERLTAMREVMKHGGPDDADLFMEQNIGLAHRRLSILDLSEKGKQPMQHGDWVLSYNGEIYNFKEIRAALSNYEFTTESDTEVLLKSIHNQGINAIKDCNGMFAISLWNKKTKTLYLTRDRLGIKPLYVYQKDDLFLFASEIKAFFEHPDFDKTLSLWSIQQYLKYGYFPDEKSVFKHIKKVSPGTWLIIENGVIREEKWYKLSIPKPNLIRDISESEALRLTEEKLTIAAEKRMIADVPVGLFLSGGVDSALLTSILSKRVNNPLKTFTIGTKNAEYDESKQAEVIAQKLGTEHETLICTPNDFREIVEKLPEIFDEPFGDSSSVLMYLISQKAREKVTVCLSGDGGDELFGGYSKYAATYNYYPKLKGFQKGIEYFSHFESSNPILFIARFSSTLAGKMTKFHRAIAAKNNADFFQKASQYLSVKELENIHIWRERKEPPYAAKEKSLISYLGYSDLMNFTEADILTKVDRSSMQHGLEVRTPYLDHELMEFAMTLPNHLKISGANVTKYLPKKILEKYLPKNLIYTPKKGFSVPVLEWLKSYYAEDLQRMAKDVDFHKTCGFKTAGLQDLSDRFLRKKYISEGYSVWFIFCLYRWYQQIYCRLK